MNNARALMELGNNELVKIAASLSNKNRNINRNRNGSDIFSKFRTEYIGLFIPLASWVVAFGSLFVKDGKLGMLRPKLVKALQADKQFMALLREAGVGELANFNMTGLKQLARAATNEIEPGNPGSNAIRELLNMTNNGNMEKLINTLENNNNGERAAGNHTRRLRQGAANYPNNFNEAVGYSPYRTKQVLRKIKKLSDERRAAFFKLADQNFSLIVYICLSLHAGFHMVMIMSDVQSVSYLTAETAEILINAVREMAKILKTYSPALSALGFKRFTGFLETKMGIILPDSVSLAVPAGMSLLIKYGISNAKIEKLLDSLDSLVPFSNLLKTRLSNEGFLRRIGNVIGGSAAARQAADSLRLAGDQIARSVREAIMASIYYIFQIIITAGAIELMRMTGTAVEYYQRQRVQNGNNNNIKNGIIVTLRPESTNLRRRVNIPTATAALVASGEAGSPEMTRALARINN